MTTILVVDDIAVIRDPIAAALRLNGFQTLVASNGKEALELVRNARPDLVLRDIAMPVMNGLEMLRAMQADASRGWPPVILLTATSDREHVLEAAKLGVRDYLLKSQFSLDQLLSRVARRLEAGGKQAPTKAAVGGAQAPASVATGGVRAGGAATASGDPADAPAQALGRR